MLTFSSQSSVTVVCLMHVVMSNFILFRFEVGFYRLCEFIKFFRLKFVQI